MKRYIYFFLLPFVLFNSCGSKKNIIYLQDAQNLTKINSDFFEYKIQVDDILKVDIAIDQVLDFNVYEQQASYSANSKDSYLYNGYQVDLDGYINLPLLGQVYVKDKTLLEIRKHIVNELKNKDILISPIVDIKLINSSFTVLGEVNRPGKYDFLKNNMNIFEALGMAGDLTINGLRKEISILRKYDTDFEVIKIDLTNSNFISNNFQIFPGDVILVKPNMTRVKNSGIIGNSGTLISLLSFVLSSIIVISN